MKMIPSPLTAPKPMPGWQPICHQRQCLSEDALMMQDPIGTSAKLHCSAYVGPLRLQSRGHTSRSFVVDSCERRAPRRRIAYSSRLGSAYVDVKGAGPCLALRSPLRIATLRVERGGRMHDPEGGSAALKQPLQQTTQVFDSHMPS
jgi:hypothetical protein